MSQAGIISTSSGPVPPTVATSYQTDSGVAVPAANILNVFGNDSTADNSNGISTTGAGNTVTVVLSNRLQGTATTVGAVTANPVTFSPTTVGTYAIEARIAGYNTTSLLGAGYSLFGSVRYDGVSMNLCGTPDLIENEEGAMSAADASLIVSGASAIIQVTGYAAQTINWSVVGLYTFVGV